MGLLHLSETHARTGLGVVERRARVVDMKPAPVRRPSVGVNADDDVGSYRVGHRGTLVHARADRAALAEAIAAAGVGAGPIMKQYVAVLKDPM